MGRELQRLHGQHRRERQWSRGFLHPDQYEAQLVALIGLHSLRAFDRAGRHPVMDVGNRAAGSSAMPAETPHGDQQLRRRMKSRKSWNHLPGSMDDFGLDPCRFLPPRGRAPVGQASNASQWHAKRACVRLLPSWLKHSSFLPFIRTARTASTCARDKAIGAP